MKHSKFGIIKSGTSTLEAGLLNLPMIIVYKANALTYLIGKTLVKLDNIGIVNILLGKTLIPELIQNNVRADKIIFEAENILNDPEKYNMIKTELNHLYEILGDKNAAKNTAQKIYNLMNEKS
jgi:lipid-A-disaccharide synthase